MRHAAGCSGIEKICNPPIELLILASSTVEAKYGVPACPILDAHGHKRILYIGLRGSTFFGGQGWSILHKQV
jgi:hypothetical protein